MQYKFDALQPQFTNELRAYHNRRRRWTTQVRFGFVDHSHNQVPLNSSPSEHPGPSTPSTHNQVPLISSPSEHPDPSTPSTPHSPHTNTFPNPNPPNFNSASLHSAIHMLNLNHDDLNPSESRTNLNNTPVPPTPANSVSSEDPRIFLNTEEDESHTLHDDPTTPSQEPLGIRNQNASFTARPTWQLPQESNLQWTWIEGNGPYITNG